MVKGRWQVNLSVIPVLKPIQDRTTTTERIKPVIESKVNSVSAVYYPNVLNSSLSFTDRL